MNFPLNRTDFKLFRGLSNPIQVLIRDVDRAPVSFAAGITPMVNIIHRQTQRVLYSSPLTLVDASQSLWTFTVLASDIADWAIGWCSYTIVTADAFGRLTALYQDRGYNLVGSVEIIDGPYPASPSAIVLPPTSFTQQANTLYGPALPGAAQLDNLSGLHTICVYGTDLTGSVTIQALLDQTMTTTDAQWINVSAITLTNLTGLLNYNFEGNFFWVRFLVNTQQGLFEQIMVRC